MDLDKLEKEIDDFEERVNNIKIDPSEPEPNIPKPVKINPDKSNSKVKEKIFKVKKSSKEEPIKKQTNEDLEIDLEDVKEVVEKDWRYIIGTGVLLAILVAIIGIAIPNTYDSSSVISLNIDNSDLFLIADAKIILESSIILQPVIDKYYEEDDKPTIEQFVLKNLDISYIEERASVKSKRFYAPYLILKVTSDNSLKSKEMNKMIVDNFIKYSKSVELTSEIPEKIDINKEQINKLKYDLTKIEEMINYRIKYDLDGDELNSPELLSRIKELEKSISEKKGQTITGVDGDLYYGKIAYINKNRREIDDIKEKFASDNYLLSQQTDIEERLSLKLFDNLQDMRDSLNSAKNELVNLKKEKLNLENSYIPITKPTLNQFGRSSQSLIKLRQSDTEDVSETLTDETILGSSDILNPVVKKDYGDNLSLNEFKQNLVIKHIIQKLDVQNIFVMPYIKITVNAESSKKAKEINEDIIKSFSSYMRKKYNMETISSKIELKENEIHLTNDSINYLNNELYVKGKIKTIDVIDLKLLSLELNERINQLKLNNLDLNQQYSQEVKYELLSKPQESIYEVVKFNLLKTSTLSFLAGIFGSFCIFIYYHVVMPNKKK